jgi:hypothetical protein
VPKATLPNAPQPGLVTAVHGTRGSLLAVHNHRCYALNTTTAAGSVEGRLKKGRVEESRGSGEHE